MRQRIVILVERLFEKSIWAIYRFVWPPIVSIEIGCQLMRLAVRVLMIRNLSRDAILNTAEAAYTELSVAYLLEES